MRLPVLLTATLASLAAATTAHAQKWEASAQLTTAAFNFRGASAGPESNINLSFPGSGLDYTNNPYGSLPGFSYGGALQLQRVTRGGLLLGLQAGYERLRSRVKLVGTYAPGVYDYLETVEGRTYLNNDFINAHPFVGRRLGLGPLDVDLTAGADLGILLHSQEEGRATNAAGRVFTTDREREQPGLDVRPRLDLTTYYRHVGLSLGYAHGLTNYRRDWVGGTNEAYSQVWRLGVAYRL